MAQRLFAALSIAMLAVGSWSARAAAQTASIALVLAVDVSTSINEDRFQLQRRGYAGALTNPAVIDAIRATPQRQIAVTFVEWAGAGSQHVVVPWTMIADAEGGQLVADQLLREPRSFQGWTSISAAIDFSVRLHADNPFPAARRVIDVSGDGVNNAGRAANEARDEAVARGISINGLAIMTEMPVPGWRPPFMPLLDEFYRDNVIGGQGAFVIVVEDFESFAVAILDKLIREISEAPLERSHAAGDRQTIRIATPGAPFIVAAPAGGAAWVQ